ncbi:MAG: DUF3015 family protein [Elusimicrobiota bacterium]|jgi:hypothetical protein
MKSFLKAGLLLVLPSIALAVGGNHTMAGCGLGYLLLSNKDQSKATQILGATTNGTSYSQTFGITSGTSGCTEDGAVKLARATEVFAEVNLNSLRQEIAAGQGEYVSTFASLLGATETNRLPMIQFLKSEYPALFPTAETGSDEMLKVLSEKLSQHPELLS